MPATTVFDRQDLAYQDRVLPPSLPAVAVEAGVSDFWRKYVGRSAAVIGIDRFGESAPGPELFRHFGFTAERVVDALQASTQQPQNDPGKAENERQGEQHAREAQGERFHGASG